MRQLSSNMKTIALILSALTLSALAASAQEALPRAEAVKFAALLNFDLAKLADTPIPTDADVKRPFGMKSDKHGGLVVPEAKLSADTLAKIGKDVQPVGQLWLAGLAPVRDGQGVPKDQLKLVTVEHEGREVTLPLCVLGVRKSDGGDLELLIYGKGKEPLLATKLAKAAHEQTAPLEFTAEREGDTARVKLSLVGKYEASFSLVPAAE
jgi:hypothetical protein